MADQADEPLTPKLSRRTLLKRVLPASVLGVIPLVVQLPQSLLSAAAAAPAPAAKNLVAENGTGLRTERGDNIVT